MAKRKAGAPAKKTKGYAAKPMDVWLDTQGNMFLHVDRIEDPDGELPTAVCGTRRGRTGRWTVVKTRLPATSLRGPRYTFDHYEGPVT
jgi:hypothetical protein